VIALTFGLALPGCLCFQAYETRWTLPDGDHAGRSSVIYENIGSSESTTEAQSTDFRDLVKYWKGDEYLLEAAVDSVYVTDRKVWLDRGRVMAEVKGIYRKLPEEEEGEEFSFSFDSTGYRFAWERDDDDSGGLTSNGRITLGDSVIIHWPPGTREFWFRDDSIGDTTKVYSLGESLKVFLAEEMKPGR